MRAVLVPVKAFAQAKIRLGSVLDAASRAALARELAGRVIAASVDTDTFVVCDDGDVADWAVAHGATVLYSPGAGLSPAVAAGVAYLANHDYDLVVVAHADLPFAHDLASFGDPGMVTIAPDRRHDGTNVIAVPAAMGFRFSYGPGSFGRHKREAERLGLSLRIVDDLGLSSDIDVPDDLSMLNDPCAHGHIVPTG